MNRRQAKKLRDLYCRPDDDSRWVLNWLGMMFGAVSDEPNFVMPIIPNTKDVYKRLWRRWRARLRVFNKQLDSEIRKAKGDKNV